MMRMDVNPQDVHPDSALIDTLGGSAEVARRIGLDPTSGGTQRVNNWKMRGIPSAIRLAHLDIFGPAPDAAKREVA